MSDIGYLDTPLTLRERARIAFIDHIENERVALENTCIKALHQIIGSDDEATIIEALPNGVPGHVIFEVDGLQIKITVKQVRRTMGSTDTGSNAGIAWEEDEICAYLLNASKVWSPISCLADIGKLLPDEPLDAEPEVEELPRDEPEPMGA